MIFTIKNDINLSLWKVDSFFFRLIILGFTSYIIQDRQYLCGLAAWQHNEPMYLNSRGIDLIRTNCSRFNTKRTVHPDTICVTTVINTSKPAQNGRHFLKTLVSAVYSKKGDISWLQFPWSLFLGINSTSPVFLGIKIYMSAFIIHAGGKTATNHYLNQHWPGSPTSYGVNGPLQVKFKSCEISFIAYKY